MLTEKQNIVLQAVRFNQYGAFNGAKNLPVDYTFNAGDWAVWSNALDCSTVAGVPTGKALSGVVSTLVQAKLLWSDGECVGFTAAGFAIVETLPTRQEITMNEFFTTLCATVNRKEVATAIVTVQTYHNERNSELRINSVQTLVKKPVEELKLLLHSLLGDTLLLTEAGVTQLPAVIPPANVKIPKVKTGNQVLAAKNARIIRILKPLDVGDGPVAMRCKLLLDGMSITAFNTAMQAAGLPYARRLLRSCVRKGQIEYVV